MKKAPCTPANAGKHGAVNVLFMLLHLYYIYLKCAALSLFATDCNKTINTTKGGKAMLSDYDDYLTPYEVAYELALSLTTVYNLLRAGKLPGLKIGRSWRIPRDALERVIYK